MYLFRPPSVEASSPCVDAATNQRGQSTDYDQGDANVPIIVRVLNGRQKVFHHCIGVQSTEKSEISFLGLEQKRQNYHPRYALIDWLIDWSIDWSIDWLIELFDWLINRLIDWLPNLTAKWFITTFSLKRHRPIIIQICGRNLQRLQRWLVAGHIPAVPPAYWESADKRPAPV